MNSEPFPLVEAVFCHLVLPPKLPRKFDGDSVVLVQNLGKRLHEALATLRNAGNPAVWDALDASLDATRTLNRGFLGGEDLLEGFRTLVESGAPIWLALHIVQQNAALLLYRDASGENIIFESFQASAPVRHVLEANHALTWAFPDRAVAVPVCVFKDESFQENLSQFLEQSSTEAFDQFAARATKRGESVVETRDCPSSALVNDMLMSLLEGLGKVASVRQIRKRVRDDVVLDSSEMPWRRSPYWLVLRVAAGRLLSTAFEDTDERIGRVYYKFLVCVVFANLLKECLGNVHPEMALFLQAKLCRRLAKLESEQQASSGPRLLAYKDLFSTTIPFFEGIINRANQTVAAQWGSYKASIVRQIPRLPRRASRHDLSLRLANSRPVLLSLLSMKSMAIKRGPLLDSPSLGEGTISQVNRLTARCMPLINYEAGAKSPVKQSSAPPEQKCIELSRKINDFVKKAGSAYRDNPLLMSRYLLRLFELWVDMDQAAIAVCPLLEQYHPIFAPQAFDVLCLLTREEMERLARVQQYIADRVEHHSQDHETIFSNPRREFAFALRFARLASFGESMLDLAKEIDEASEEAEKSKESELGRLNRQYHNLTEEIQSLACTCPKPKKKRKCEKCQKRRSRKRLKIAIHEDFLPSPETKESEAHRAAIVYELLVPNYLAAYRHATWNLYLLGSPPTSTRLSPPQLLLERVDMLKPFIPKRASEQHFITLASRKKLFSQTHYRQMKIPKRPYEVLLPFGAEFSYYDTTSGLWAEELPEVPWFQHLLGPWLPEGISDPYESYNPSEEKVYHPTSYDVIANETNCPPEMSLHEFSAYQRVVSGRGRRWLNMLIELSSTNINFSSETATALFTRLALQAGPSTLSGTALREAHVVFRDEAFCETLRERLSCLLTSLESTYREVHCMGTMVILSLRLHHLCRPGLKDKALELLVRIRHITCNWIVQLRNEVRMAHESETVRKASDYAFRAALLCRQTFSIYIDAQVQHATPSHDDLRCFFRASIALQEHLSVSVDELSPTLKHHLVQDLSNSCEMGKKIESWVQQYPHCLEDAIDETWSDAEGLEKRTYSNWRALTGTYNWWVTAQVQGTGLTAPQVIHYHLVQGHLTVDGKPLGRLPIEMREDPAIKELFGGQHLLTRPSSIMQHQLVNQVEGHQIHFGMRGQRVVIRAIFRGSLLEHVPRDVFRGNLRCDLPSGLVDDCVHWLNLHTGKLEMRRKPRIWRPKPSNWILDVQNRQAVRNAGLRTKYDHPSLGTYLVEPQSDVGQKICHIFRGFEDAERLTMYQPSGSGSLSVEMKRLEIRFSVNTKGLLECPQLRAEVDPQQDIGCLYGLSSQVTLRGVADPDRKSVLVPIGNMRWERRGMHVAVSLENDGLYAKFTVDQLLGRLDCPPEPHLLYLKAALHALTSFLLPDRLTGRTGTEEARHCLLAARSKPWAPLPAFPQQVLSVIRSLSPKRWRYPQGLGLYQRVKWDNHLTMTIQHEGLAPLVDSIILRSEDLKAFAQTSEVGAESEFELDNDAIGRLRLRGCIRRQVYERVCFPVDSAVLEAATPTVTYSPPKHNPASKESCQVYQTVRALQGPTSGIFQFPSLTPILETWGTVGGFDNVLIGSGIKAALELDMSQLWGSFAQSCLRKGLTGAYNEHFRLGLLAFNSKTDMNVVAWLVALFKNSILRGFEAPKHSSFSGFQAFEAPSEDTLRALVLAKQPDYDVWSGKATMENRNGSNIEQHYAMQTKEATQIASLIIDGGPRLLRSLQEFEEHTQELVIEHIDLEKAWQGIQPELQRLYHNLKLSAYLLQVDEAAKEIRQQQSSTVSEKHSEIWSSKPATMTTLNSSRVNGAYSVPHLTSGLMKKKPHFHNAPRVRVTMDELSRQFAATRLAQDSDAPKTFSLIPEELTTLSEIVKRFKTSPDITRQQYGNDLEVSLEALIRNRSVTKKPKHTHFAGGLVQAIADSHQALEDQADMLRSSLSHGEVGFPWLDVANLWPCLSPVMLLEQLRDSNKSHLGPEMREELLLYGTLFTKLQRLVRMHDAQLCRDEKRLREEHEHEGHSNWSPIDHPEWLLLEIDNNILIRPSQVDVARAIISPTSGSNSVLQMNMGQGKTSCVMPMAVTVLADNTQLCRLVVPRALLLQTAQVLQSRIGGLVGRQVCHIPFTRRSPSGKRDLALFHNLHQETLASGGVMLCLPEHILSFKLSGLQKLADNKKSRAKTMVGIQQWLDTSCRDVLDESDFTLSAKTQLIYPSGTPTTVDGHPQRWLVVEGLLALVETHVSHLQSSFEDGVDVRRLHKGYPIIHFLRTEVEDSLNALLVADICEGHLPQLQLKDSANENAQRDIGMIVSGLDVPSSTWKNAAESLADDVCGPKILHLLRGLISQRVLLLCLKKRWNVQYGLHPRRAPIAVPFEAKGVPSETAEYGHPDTALVLTCLAFYQTGLSKEQVARSLQHIMKSDDPSAHYERLVYTSSLPTSLQQWNLLDTEDEVQMTELWRLLRFDRNAVNYFLNNFAFPQHAKQFSVKLQASGWDIPLLSRNLPSKSLTTGFSGTNDNKRTLPHTIKQDDLPSLIQTNAEVLGYLLEPRNQRLYQAADRTGKHLSEIGLLELLRNEGIRILIDAGAHILEMENHHLASAWLDIFPDAQGAVYFDHESRIMVRARFQKAAIPLLASPFADNLKQCVVYIDEAHTRGTDLRLPVYARAAVTLGLGQTKDQTVQAAMRLRQLGSTQSVAFVAPPEVYQSIIRLRNTYMSMSTRHLPVTSVDVVHWLLEQSCVASENIMPLYLAQGFDFCRRANALWKYAGLSKACRRELLKAIQRREDQTLEQLYGVRPLDSAEPLQLDFPHLETFATQLCQQIRESSSDCKANHSSSPFEEVEQEREVEFEVEQVRENQKLTRLIPLRFLKLDPAIVDFATTGKLNTDTRQCFIQAFDLIGRTSIGCRFGVKGTASKLFASPEFARTVQNDALEPVLDIVRPVEWILWSKWAETAILITPEEAELLLPILRRLSTPWAWLLAYAAPVTKSMQVFNTLKFLTIPALDEYYSLPPWVPIEVGIVAGRLYFDYREYRDMLAWLGIFSKSESQGSVTRGLFIDLPLKFLLEWLTYRRQTADILHTPMGYVCQSRPLNGEHAFFNSTAKLQGVTSGISRLQTSSGHHGDGDTSDDDSEWEDGDGGVTVADKSNQEGEMGD